MKSSDTGERGDVIAVSAIACAAVAIGWPVLAGGYLTYLDNPSHIAEVYALAGESVNGWSEIAYCGFPIGTLHSPMWYGLLAAAAGIGLPAGPVYCFLMLMGFLAPALAVYRVSRRCLKPVAAAGLAFVVLVQRPAVVGVGSAWGGMWTFYLAAGLYVLLADELSRRDRSPAGAVRIAALTGGILLTHLYTVVPLAILAAIHMLVSSGRRRVLLRDALAGAAGLLAASAYWLPVVLARDAIVIHPQNLDAVKILARLILPTHVLELINGRWPVFGAEVMIDSLPMVLLVLAGCAGVLRLSRRSDDGPLYGALSAGVLLAILVFVTGEFDARFLGPGSWRMLYFVRLGLALAAIPVLGTPPLSGGRPGRLGAARAAVAAALAVVFAGAVTGRPLRAVTEDPGGSEMKQVEELWNWLESNRTAEWGRVYLQDTFDLPHAEIRLSQSHVLALTAKRTGVRQLGATYGVAPYRTVDWTPGEFGTLFRTYVRDDADVERVLEWAWAANTTHVVVSEPRTRRVLDARPDFEKLFVAGRFAVYAVGGLSSEWASALTPDTKVEITHFRTGSYGIRAHCPGDYFAVFVKSSWFPGWSLTGAGDSGLRLSAEPSGLMRIEGRGGGIVSIGLEYRQARWPRWLSLTGWLLIAAVAWRVRPRPLKSS